MTAGTLSPDERRLARLLAVRLVRLQAAGRRLAAASAVVSHLQTTTARIDRLRNDLGLPVQLLCGYEAKALTAARALLGDANARQRARITEAKRRHASATAAVTADHAAADAVERAIERAVVARPKRQEFKR